MRALIAGVFVALTSPVAGAADKDEDKAKAVTLAFLKAVKAKDLDSAMKMVDAPLMFEYSPKTTTTIEKADELKAAMTKFLDKVTPDKVPTEVGDALDMTALAKFAKEKGLDDFPEMAEKLVGKSGYLVMMKAKDGTQRSGILVRIKDGKALVAGIPK